MPMFRFKASGYFMGNHFEKGDEVDLHEKQAKYALLSGQLEWVTPPPPKAAKKAMAAPFTPRGVVAGTPKKILDEHGEYSVGRSVGGSTMGHVKK